MEIIADYPAYTITAHDPQREYQAGDMFAIPYQSRPHGTLYRFYTLGSVRALAREYKQSPEQAVTRAIERGHALWWANQNGTTLTAHKREKGTFPAHEIGDRIKFEGKTFVLAAAPNHNITLQLD